MAIDDEYFPRGKQPIATTAPIKTITPIIDEDEQLFKSRKRKPEPKSTNQQTSNKRSKKSKKSKSNDEDANTVENLKKTVIETLTINRLIENTVILGCLQDISEFELKFSITNGINVIVPITNISTPYSKLIENFTNNVDDVEIVKLSSIFNIGEYYPIKIISKQKKLNNTFKIIGSLNPKDIYANFSSNTFKNLPENFNIVAAISSKEDHGYLLDIGSKDVKAFLSDNDLKQEESLYIGQLIKCSIVNVVDRIIMVKICFKKFLIDYDQQPSISMFVPGTKTAATIMAKNNYGLELELPGGYKGFVTNLHLNDDLSVTSKQLQQLKIGNTIQGYVLYVHPHTKQISITLKSLLTVKKIKKFIDTIRIGKVIDKAIVCSKMYNNMGIIFRLSEMNMYAIAFRKNLFEKDELKNNDSIEQDLDDKYYPGSEHRCRIKKINLFDQIIEISLRKSFIEQMNNDLTANDLEIGQIINVIVQKYNANGIIVKIGFDLNGFIPNIHLSDSPILTSMNLEKIREKYFSLKKQVKCRILKINSVPYFSINNNCNVKITLTAKKSLLNLPEKLIFKNLEEIQPLKSSSLGVVCLIQEQGILLEFFNNIRGFIPKKYLATYEIEYPEKIFKLGQLVNCTVISIDMQSKHMICSLINPELTTPDDDNDDKDKSKNKKEKFRMNLKIDNKNNSMLRIGQIMTKMRIISKQPKGFDLVDAKEKYLVFLPAYHLSDDRDICRHMYNTLNVNDIIDELMIYSKDSTNIVCATMKQTFVQRNSSLIMNEQDIKLNEPFPAIVRNVIQNGVYFETTNLKFGFIRKRFVQDGYFDDPKKIDLNRGQTIFVTAIDVNDYESLNHDNQSSSDDNNFLKHFKFSMKLSNVLIDNASDPKDSTNIEILKSYFQEMNSLQKFLSNNSKDDQLKLLSSFKIGEIITFSVTEIKDDHIRMNCSRNGYRHEPIVQGIVDKRLYTDKDELDLQISQMGQALICDVDFDNKTLKLFIQPSKQQCKLLKQIKNFKQFDKIKLKQVVKGTVVYVNAKYVMIIFNGHLPGLIGFVPVRRHFNDLRHIESLYSINHCYQFMIEYFQQNNDNKDVLVLAKLYDSSMKSKLPAKPEKSTKKIDKNKTITTVTNDENKSDDNQINTEDKSSQISKQSQPKVTTFNQSPAATKKAIVNQFDWNVLDLKKLTNKRKFDKLQNANTDDDGDGQNQFNDDSDSDFNDDHDGDSDNELDQKQRKRMKRNEQARQQESMIREKEMKLLNINENIRKHRLEDEQDFEMAVIQEPNNSLLWIEYMAYFIERKQIDKAREIGERALAKISFREENEKLNIWTSLMNIENQFGTEQSMNELIEKALKFNDRKVIYLRLADVYDNNEDEDGNNDLNSEEQFEKAKNIYEYLCKKYSNNQEIWLKYLRFLMKNQKIESGRKLFVKSLSIFDQQKQQQIELMSKFAQYEFQFGNIENGKTIFEKLLSLYWERLDKWSIYIDMLIKYTLNKHENNDDNDDDNSKDSIEFIRSIFERLLTFKFKSTHKMRFIFKKYLDFETRFGNNSNIERLQRLAAEYIEKGVVLNDNL